MKKTPQRKLQNFIFYAGFDKSRFYNYYSQSQDAIRQENRNNLLIVSLLGSVIFAVIFIASFFLNSVSDYTFLYGVMCGVSFLTFIINKLWKESFGLLQAAIHLFVFAMFAFAIILGTLFSPSDLTVTFFVFLVAAPLVFVDRPHRFILVLGTSFIVYVVMAAFFKDSSILGTDIVNAAVFTVFSMAVCLFSMRVKLQKFFLECEIRQISETDSLTGVKNRYLFDKAIADYDVSLLPKTYFIYADVNGLHELNNILGHEAGDEMLRAIANILLDCFGENVYRIGGDEFVSFGNTLTRQEVEDRLDDVAKRVSDYGYHVAFGYDFGHIDYSMEELIKNAELRMYAAKSAYYGSAEHDRRRR